MSNSQLIQMLRFLLRSVVAGLAIAFLLLYVFPGILPERNDNRKLLDFVQDQVHGPASYRAAVDAISPAVVNIYATRIERQRLHPLFQDPLFQRFFDLPVPAERRNNTLGSGVIMSTEGYLLTNAHVISQADEITVTLNDGRRTQATIVGIDAETDLAVLKILMQNIMAATVADSARVRAGDVVLAIGNPYDLGHTVSQGIVSATGRKRLGITTFEDFIQTDAFINPGNSGGALVNAEGRLIGINTAIARTAEQTQGIGFAIPINLARNIMQQLITQGYVIRGWLGIEAQVLPKDIADAADIMAGGVLVAGVLTGGPAAKAGIKPGDILISINGEKLRHPQHAITLITGFRPDMAITIEMMRGWERMTLDAVVAQRPGFAN